MKLKICLNDMSNTENLPTSPDWEFIDEEFQFFAVDANGSGFVFESEPEILERHDEWYSYDSMRFIGDFDATNWKNSLQKRPQHEK